MCVDADAIVIGAGAAGLAAARRLARRSVRAVVLEARDRVGGRVWPRPAPGIPTPAELGAEFIHGRAELTMRLLREAGTAAVDAGGQAWACAEGGRLGRREDGAPSAAAGIFEAARALPADESVDRFLGRFEGDEAARETARAARAFVEGFDAADPAIASARAIADEWRAGADFAIARPLGGYRPMVEHLREACVAAGVQICLSTVVRRLSWRRGAVAVEATGGEGARTIRARAAILTLPVGVLRHPGGDAAVAFDPPLPPAKGEALRRIEMGQAVKVALWFRTAFWERVQGGRYRGAAFFRCDGRPRWAGSAPKISSGARWSTSGRCSTSAGSRARSSRAASPTTGAGTRSRGARTVTSPSGAGAPARSSRRRSTTRSSSPARRRRPTARPAR